MKKAIFSWLMMGSFSAFAALPPWVQEERDRDSINYYIEDHPEIKEHIKRVDYEDFIIYLDNGCRLIFERHMEEHPPGWVGPQSPIYMDRKECASGLPNGEAAVE